MEIPMMAGLFFIIFLAALLVMLGYRRGAIALFLLELACAVALFIHHMTDQLIILL